MLTSSVGRFTIAPGSWQLEIPPVPALPDPRIRDQVDALAPVAIDVITSHLADVRRWDKAAGKLARQLYAAKPNTRDSHLVMLAALCQQSQCLATGREKECSRAAGTGAG